MKEKRILFTGGGTAGHVIVNLALIPYFQKNNWQIDYIGSKTGIEKDLIEPLENVDYHMISTGKLRRYFSIQNFTDPFRILKGIWQSIRVIGKAKPQIVFSKGGFVSVPVVLAARLRRIPIIIHESDLTPGLANKIATKFADKVLTTFPETIDYLPQEKTEYIGAVIRDEIFQGDREKAYTFLGENTNKPVLLVMGGSIGSKYINDLIRNHLEQLLEKYQIVHLCGKGFLDPTINRQGYHQYEYLNDELKDILAITDFVLSRAGANAIFEFLALKIPMLLIPLSKTASRGDQIDNANSFEKQGLAQVIEEEALNDENLFAALQYLTENRADIVEKMASKNEQSPNEKVIQLIHQLKK